MRYIEGVARETATPISELPYQRFYDFAHICVCIRQEIHRAKGKRFLENDFSSDNTNDFHCIHTRARTDHAHHRTPHSISTLSLSELVNAVVFFPLSLS